jgi:hypothetical protein
LYTKTEGLTSQNAAETLRTLRQMENEVAATNADASKQPADSKGKADAGKAADTSKEAPASASTSTAAAPAAAAPAPAASSSTAAAASSSSASPESAGDLTPEQKAKLTAQQRLVENIMRLTDASDRKNRKNPDSKAEREKKEQVQTFEALALGLLANLSVQDDPALHANLLQSGSVPSRSACIARVRCSPRLATLTCGVCSLACCVQCG